jgi:hypothetical protein
MTARRIGQFAEISVNPGTDDNGWRSGFSTLAGSPIS